MHPNLLSLIPISLFAVLLVTAATYDFLLRRIPNWTVVALILLFVASAVLGWTQISWASALLAFAIALVGSGALYLMGWLGAGDTKLLAATALFAGLSHLLLLVVATALVGGLYALVVLIIRPKEVMRGMTARGRAEGKLRGIPYGVAIAAGALITAFLAHTVEPGPVALESKPEAIANAK